MYIAPLSSSSGEYRRYTSLLLLLLGTDYCDSYSVNLIKDNQYREQFKMFLGTGLHASLRRTQKYVPVFLLVLMTFLVVVVYMTLTSLWAGCYHSCL